MDFMSVLFIYWEGVDNMDADITGVLAAVTAAYVAVRDLIYLIRIKFFRK